MDNTGREAEVEVDGTLRVVPRKYWWVCAAVRVEGSSCLGSGWVCGSVATRVEARSRLAL